LLDDWNFPGSDKLAELEQTGANSVRIQWYMEYPTSGSPPSRPPYSVTDLDNFLTRCKTYRMIPILGLWDFTCNPDPGLLDTEVTTWWTTDPILSVLKKHMQYIIINPANELGFYRWAGDNAQQVSALAAFKNAYIRAIGAIRLAGLTMPLMIDAPDCGTSINAFTSIGEELINRDLEHNLLLSVHAYWADYDGTAEIQKAFTDQLPIVFGEIANKQANGDGDQCYFGLDGTNLNHAPPTGFSYQDLLITLKSMDIGWLAWSWWPDACASRRMSQNGDFGGLTTYGSDIVDNPIYGLRNTAVRSSAFA